MTAEIGIWGTIKHIIAMWLMMKALKLVARKNDAGFLRIAIPLTLALLETMGRVSSEALKPYVGTFREKLAEMRLKLARLEGTETTLTDA